ncbi:MAG: phenylalanine--tRNA ligase subunit beta [Saccharofermentanaceae bacterium]|jgi:phenylalanyl-tRNA synthetase beta chain|nr:phenylalanine--tRNA ligase subunit beta [Clostridia bacterium]NLX68775.1 phenylalanine--tRNA ligase subunit beta [Clostridiaceae bacterium]HOO48293.1 phenylalanine--tRNA ligase subunit beta [Saccharofermentans sp.]HPQ31789.1 phenylalanine--tRNA ligase subunit beta [Saccharofermentans sp.]HRV50154.1 phenylalanine--tRNA ligase subunit beta [Saccharofermentans sp.]
MLLSMNWISDFVDLTGLDRMQLISRFSLSTAEVENEIFEMGKELSGVVVGQILSVENHPSSKKLHLLKVDCGRAEPVDIVCGAPNVRVGMKTALATLGANVDGIVIEPRDLAGCTSYGMCCSEKEIGISAENNGIMDILEDVANGTDIKELYDIDDIIFEVDNKSLTNRPDLWCHYGIAREFAALAERELKLPEVTDLSVYNNLPAIDMKIEDPLCQRYSCLRFENIKVNVSPVNMRIRLFYCGMRSINLLADLTNYLMLELGQPMHAFDSRKVESIRIRRFDKPFVFRTLDGIDRNIDENTLMVCNGDKPVAIAGIMGGYDSEIVDDTHTLSLESATFNSVSIRKSTVRLSHRTDASMRYEKSLDPELTVYAIARFVKLLKEIDPGIEIVSSLTDEYAYKYETVVLDFNKQYVDRYTGIEIDNEAIIKTLSSLGFKVTNNGDDFSVVVPSWRATKDVTIKADIIEEITRIYGYDNFDIHTAYAPMYPLRHSIEKIDEDKIKDILVKKYSLHEIQSYIWAYSDEYKALGMDVEDNIKLINSTNPNIETIRRSIVPTQLCQMKYNTSYSSEFGLFETGRVVLGLDENNLCVEKKKLCITLFSKIKDTETLFFELRNVLCVLADDIKHTQLAFKSVEAQHSYQHIKNNFEVVAGDVVLGQIGVVHPSVCKKIDKKASIVYAEIDISDFANIINNSISYEETSKFPGIEIDLTFISDSFLPISKAISMDTSGLVSKVSVVGTYSDDSGKSITVRILFAHKERTLTSAEVKEVVDVIVNELDSEGVSLKQ